MKIIIIEDEHAAAKNLSAIVTEIFPDIEILAVLESVEESITWIKNNKPPDLGFFDIQLADGTSFEVFKQTDIDFPVIFTTAYNEYAIQAFKVNSIDYLLKPVKQEDVQAAMLKFINMGNISYTQGILVIQLLQDIQKRTLEKKYKKAFLVHYKDKLITLSINDIALFYIESGNVFCFTYDNQKYILEQKLEKIENQINPDDFFRANRQFIISRYAIKEVDFYFNGRLILKTNPSTPDKVIVSKAKAGELRSWLDM
jgi:two-component system LytT family response regulator